MGKRKQDELAELEKKLANLKDYMFEADVEAIGVIGAQRAVAEEMRPLLAAAANLEHNLGILDMRKKSLMDTVAQTLFLIEALEQEDGAEGYIG